MVTSALLRAIICIQPQAYVWYHVVPRPVQFWLAPYRVMGMYIAGGCSGVRPVNPRGATPMTV